MERILGIDPGSRVCGFALVQAKKIHPIHIKDFDLEDLGVLKAETSLSFPERIGLLHERLYDLISELKPTHCVIEDSFCGNNPRSALKLGQARGALISAIQRHRLPIIELTPSHVKSMIAGRGGATKEEIARYLSLQFSKDFMKIPFDATDALAIALAFGVSGFRRSLTSCKQKEMDILKT